MLWLHNKQPPYLPEIVLTTSRVDSADHWIWCYLMLVSLTSAMPGSNVIRCYHLPMFSRKPS